MNIINSPLRDCVLQDAIIDTNGQNYLSNMPSDIFKEITEHLHLREMRALSLTHRNIFSTVNPIILLKTQGLLEDLASLFDDNIFELIIKWLEDLENGLYLEDNFENSLKNKLEDRKLYKNLIYKSKKFSNGTSEKCQALRDLICFGVKKFKVEPLEIFKRAPSLHDDLLITQVIQNFARIDERLLLVCDCNKKDHVDSTLLYLNVLKKNKIKPYKVRLTFKGHPWDSNIFEVFLKAIKANHSVNDVHLRVTKWDFSHLAIFLDGIKNLEHITNLRISSEEDQLDDLNQLFYDKLNGVFGKQSQINNDIYYKRLEDNRINKIIAWMNTLFVNVYKIIKLIKGFFL